MKGNALIAQGGGPTAVINQSLAGVIEMAQRNDSVENIYGALHGVSGIINEKLLNLSNLSKEEIEDIAVTPSSALGSTRDKPDSEYCRNILDILKKYNVKFFFYNGGNDSADTCRLIKEMADSQDYDLIVIHIPKTIDNDLLVTDHSPGFGSAAKFVCQAFAGIDMDMRSIPGIYIGIVMGRDAGYLTGASALARANNCDGPHLIYLPEFPFVKKKFLADVKAVYEKYGRCVIAVSEGIKGSDGVPIVTRLLENNETDAHGNVQLSGNGALGDSLAQLIKDELKVKRVRADTFGYLQRSFLGIVSENDAKEAREVGRKAVEFAFSERNSGSVAIRRIEDYEVDYFLTPLSSVAKNTKSMDESLYCIDKSMVTDKFIKYVSPLVGDLPIKKLLSAPKV